MFSNIQSLLQSNLTERDIFITVEEKCQVMTSVASAPATSVRDVQSAAGGKKSFGLGFC